MAELVPVQHQGLDMGGAHPQALLQQLPPGHILPVPVLDVDGQGTMLGLHNTGGHCVYRVLTLFKMKPT